MTVIAIQLVIIALILLFISYQLSVKSDKLSECLKRLEAISASLSHIEADISQK